MRCLSSSSLFHLGGFIEAYAVGGMREAPEFKLPPHSRTTAVSGKDSSNTAYRATLVLVQRCSYLRPHPATCTCRLAYSAAIGDIRSTRGAVLIRSQGGQELSWDLIFDVARAAPGQWTHISVVLREDHGWVHEPLGQGVTTAEMKDVLENASEMLIRGDLRVYGRGGGGQEVVYLQDVRLLAKD